MTTTQRKCRLVSDVMHESERGAASVSSSVQLWARDMEGVEPPGLAREMCFASAATGEGGDNVVTLKPE